MTDDVAAILDDVLVRRARGERLPDEQILQAHPQHREELAVGLARIRAMEETISQPASDHLDSDGASEPPAARDGRAAGDRVGHYLLQDLLGEGGFGTVWLAWDEKLECHVALKLPRRITTDVDRVMREARLVAGMPRHPHIVGVLAADTDEDIAWIASEYIDGVTLTDWLASGIPDQYAAADLCRRVADAVAHVHAAGIIHRDLKTDNVLMDRANEPRVTDFGLAVEDGWRTSESGLSGTLPYMAPEQVSGGTIDGRTDVYAIGVILFELLTGQRPFRGNAETLLAKIRDAEPPSPRSLVDHRSIARDIESISLKCLEKSPEHRYRSAAELRDDLRRFLRHEPVQARPVTVVGRLSRWCRRHPSIPLLSLTIVAGLLAILLVTGRLLRREVDSMQERLIQAAEDGLQNSALTITRLLEAGLRERFQYVVLAASDPQLQDALRRSPRQPVTPGQAVPAVQSWITAESGIPRRSRSDVFSWFVCNADGVQVARLEEEPQTLGQSFAWRSYFTGRPHDGNSHTPPEIVWTPGTREPRLSDVFLTVNDKAWVLAISAPVWDDSTAEPRLLGVVGVFLSIRAVLDNVVEPQKTDTGCTRFAYLLFESDDSGLARIIDHPFQSSPVARDASGRIRDEVAKVTVSSRDLAPTSDPYESARWSDAQLGAAARQLFGGPWLAASRSAVLPGTPSYPQLRVVVCESAASVTAPGQDLRFNLTLFGITTLALVLALLVPIWLIILRRSLT